MSSYDISKSSITARFAWDTTAASDTYQHVESTTSNLPVISLGQIIAANSTLQNSVQTKNLALTKITFKQVNFLSSDGVTATNPNYFNIRVTQKDYRFSDTTNPTTILYSGSKSYGPFTPGNSYDIVIDDPTLLSNINNHIQNFGVVPSLFMEYCGYFSISNMDGCQTINFVTNNPPNAPTALTPSGTLTAPSFVKSVTPTLSWNFSDPDSGNTQSGFQVQLFNSAGTVILDSQQVNSGTMSYTVPSNVLQPNTTYSWSVRTWDNAGLVGPYATNQSFTTSHAPSAAGLSPGSLNSATPAGCSVTPHLTWTYSDVDGDAEAAYQVKIYNVSTGMIAYDSQKVTSANTYHDVPSGVLGAGINFYWNVTVWDSTGMSTTSSNVYILTNNPPAPVTLISPINTYRVTTRPVFVANIGDDVENDKQNFKIQLADDTNFTQNVQEFSTQTTQTGWEAFDGTSWVPFAAGGMDYTYEGKQVCYTWQSDLTEGKTYYWRIAPIDGTTGSPGAWSSVRAIRVGDTLQFKLKNPLKTSAPAKKVLLSGKWTLPTDGNTPASLKVEVCNNGLDASPTWEDATNALLSSQYYLFTNTTKTGTDWAVDCRVTIKSNDSLGAVEFDGIGFTLQ